MALRGKKRYLGRTVVMSCEQLEKSAANRDDDSIVHRLAGGRVLFLVNGHPRGRRAPGAFRRQSLSLSQFENDRSKGVIRTKKSLIVDEWACRDTAVFVALV